MSKKSDKSAESEFAKLFNDATPMRHDKYVAPRAVKRKTAKFESAQKQDTRRTASFEFSDGFIAQFDQQETISYVKDAANKPRLAALKRGQIIPELELDLHGYTREEAKREIAAMISHAHKHHFECLRIIHGVSGGVLRRYTPNWLVQHPLVIGFNQAPKHLGGAGALLLLISIPA